MMKHFLSACGLLAVCACGTIQTAPPNARLEAASLDGARRSHCEAVPSLYSGFSYDMCASLLARPGEIGQNTASLLYLLDAPLSLAADTVILPYTLYQQASHGNVMLKRQAQ